MQKNRTDGPRDLDDVVSIIGPGMKIVGDCSSDGTIRVEGNVEGSVKAGKSVVVGTDGVVKGDIATQDAIIAGTVDGSVTADSRVELQATCRVQGDIRSRRVKLDEGGQVDGQLHMGANAGKSAPGSAARVTSSSGSAGSLDSAGSSKEAATGGGDSGRPASEEKSSQSGSATARSGR